MNDKTLERLYAVGWKEERNINIDNLKTRYHEIGLNMPLNLIFCLTNHTHIDNMMIDIRRTLDPRLLGKISLAGVFYFYNIL